MPYVAINPLLRGAESFNALSDSTFWGNFNTLEQVFCGAGELLLDVFDDVFAPVNNREA